MQPTMKKIFADFLLFITAVLWGSTFIFQRIATLHMEAFSFNAARFLLAAITMFIAVLIWEGKNTHEKPAQSTYLLRFSGVLGGALLAVGINLQQIALAFTTVGKAGFLTGLYVILVPIIGFFISHKITTTQWISTILATIGLYFMSIQKGFSLEIGDALVIISAFIWALYILYLNSTSKHRPTMSFAMEQYFYCGLISLIAGLVSSMYKSSMQNSSIGLLDSVMQFFTSLYQQSTLVWHSIAYAALLSTCVGFSLQVYAQRYTPATHAALIISLEAVFAALFGALLLHEVLSPRESLGAILIFSAMILAQIIKTDSIKRKTLQKKQTQA